MNSFGALLPLGPTIDPGPSGEDPDIVSGNRIVSSTPIALVIWQHEASPAPSNEASPIASREIKKMSLIGPR